MKKPRRRFRARRRPEAAPERAPEITPERAREKGLQLAAEIALRRILKVPPRIAREGELEMVLERSSEISPLERAALEQLRGIRGSVDPFRTYPFRLPDGQDFEVAGADLIATGEAMVALQDAIDRGEPMAVLKAAFERLGLVM
jgi:hypothetical protein